MVVRIPAPPAPVPPCEPQPSARGFVSGIRTAAIGASDCAEVMRDNATPEGWEGDASEAAAHAMTATAGDLDATVAALQKVVAAGDTFFDRLDRLVDRRDRLVDRRQSLVADLDDFAARAADYEVETEEAGLQAEAAGLRARVQDLEGDVATWSADLAGAEDDFVAALRSSDTPGEADGLADQAPDTGALTARLARLRQDPQALHAWWSDLTPAQREALKIMHPQLVGGSDGIPTVDRDEANRGNLSEDLNSLRQREEDGELTDDEQVRLGRLDEIYDSLALAGNAVPPVIDTSTGDAVVPYLLLYRPDAALGDGTAALAWGNPDTAANVSINVPGFGSTLDNFSGVSGDALNVFREAGREGNGSVASVAWLGYNAPDPDQLANPLGLADAANVANEAAAHYGAGELSRFVDGLRASDGRGSDSDANMTVIGHSYGSTTVANASGDGLDVDSTVLVGSPGAGAGNDHASDLSGDVYVGSADNDFVSRLGNPTMGGLGNDPAGSDFGANRFNTEDVSDGAFDIDNHTSYFNPGSDSLDDVGRIVAGNGDDIDRIDGRGSFDNTLWWADNTAGDAGRWVGDRASDATGAARDGLGAVGDVLDRVTITPVMPRVGWPF